MRSLLLLLATAALAGCSLFGSDLPEPLVVANGAAVTVSEVHKGDEVSVSKDGKSTRVRLLGIQAFGEEVDALGLTHWRTASIAALRTMIMGKTVSLNLGTPPRDDRGRTLAFVALDGQDVGRTMLTLGLATVYTEFKGTREASYFAAESEARVAKKGIWGSEKLVLLAHGLREQWARFRAERGGDKPADPLLDEPAQPATPTAPPTPR